MQSQRRPEQSFLTHYAGVGCEMNKIMEIARRHNLKVVEDAAQGVDAYYHGKALGTIGDFGCYSFHETKNFTMGEGGALVFQKNEYQEKAEILREKERTEVNFSEDRLINIDGLIMDHPIFRAR